MSFGRDPARRGISAGSDVLSWDGPRIKTALSFTRGCQELAKGGALLMSCRAQASPQTSQSLRLLI